MAGTLMSSGAGTERPAGMASEPDFLVPVTQALTGTFANGGADDNKAQGGFLVPVRNGPVSVGCGSYPTAREDLAPTITGRHGDPGSVAHALLAHPGARQDGESETFIPVAFDLAQITSADNRSRVEPGLPAPTLHTGGGAHAIVAASADVASEDVAGVPPVAHTLCAEGADASEDGTGRGVPMVVGRQGLAVRRLTPRECERLQGFPDDWTRWDDRGREIAGGPRYRMVGNAIAIPVFRWLFNRIRQEEATA